jgi:cysteine synthase A
MRDIALPPDGGLLSTIGNTPLVPLRRLFPGIAFDLYAKLELLNPGGSSKDRTALSLLREAWEEGRITSASTIVESSSGNLGIGIAQFCTYMGLRFICVVDSRTTPVNLKILEAYGVEIDMVRDCDAPSGDLLRARVARVQQLCEEIPDSFWPNQYANTANSRAHQTTMREIYESLQGKVDYLFVATSSCGTLRGCAEFLREAGASTRIVAIDAEGSVIFGGRPGRRLIPGHGASRVPELYQPDLEDAHLRVSDLDCVTGCYQLLHREAIFAGGSSGGIVSAIARMKDEIPTGSTCVMILCDRGDRYLDTVYSRKWVEESLGQVDVGHQSAMVSRATGNGRFTHVPALNSETRPGMLMLRGEEIIRLLEHREREIINTIRDAYITRENGGYSLPNCEYLRFPGNNVDRIIPKPAYLGGPFQAAGIKWVSSFPGNLEDRLERASATLILNSVKTGFAEAMMEGSVISSYRTAASAALAADILHAGKRADTLGVIGCGPINFEVLRFLLYTRPEVKEVVLYDADPYRTRQFQTHCRSFCDGRTVTQTTHGQHVLEQADIVSIATNAVTPHIENLAGRGDDLTLLHISLRDLTPHAIALADNIVDDIDHVCSNGTSLDLAALSLGHRRFIRATLGEILLGKQPPRSSVGPLIFSPFGLGILDIAMGCLVRDFAAVAHAGTAIEGFQPVPWTQRSYGAVIQR